MEFNRYCKSLIAGQNEAKDYNNWYKKNEKSEIQNDSFAILNDIEDDAEDEPYEDHYLNYMYFLLDALTVHDHIYEYKMLDWVADWWRKFDPETKYRTSYNHFWEYIWRNPNSGFLFANRLHMKNILYCGISRYEKPIEQHHHLGDHISLLIDIVKNEGNGAHIDWVFAVENTHPKVMKLVEEHFENGSKEGSLENYTRDYANMCRYHHQIHLIEKYQHLLFDDTNDDQEYAWYSLGYNKNAVHILKENRNKWENNDSIFSNMISCVEMLPLLESYIENGFKEKKDWTAELCQYEYGLPYVEQYIEQFTDNCWYHLCKNPSAISLIETNFSKINCELHHVLYSNPNAFALIQEKNVVLDLKAWDKLVDNPDANDFIEQHINDLNNETHIIYLNENLHRFPLLEKYRHLIRPEILLHPQIFYKKPAQSQ